MKNANTHQKLETRDETQGIRGRNLEVTSRTIIPDRSSEGTQTREKAESKYTDTNDKKRNR